MVNWQSYFYKPIEVLAYQVDRETYVDTLKGKIKVDKGDWIIKGNNGELYSCKSDKFRKYYKHYDYE